MVAVTELSLIHISLWKQIIANVMNIEVDVLEVEEGPSLGGPMLAAVGCGVYPDVETAGKKLAKVVDTVEPTPELAAKYEDRKSTRLNSSHITRSRMPSSA